MSNRRADPCLVCRGTGIENETANHWFQCRDCRFQAHDYMLHDEVWLQAWPTYEEESAALHKRYPLKRDVRMTFLELCFFCVEKRLGRLLTPADFDLRIPVNHNIALGLRMGIVDRKPGQ